MAGDKQKEKLQNLAETKKIIQYQQKHYQKLLNHFDDQITFIDNRIAEHDKEIAVLQEAKAKAARQFAEAPEQLIILARELKEVMTKERDLKRRPGAKMDKIASLKKRIKNLKERLAKTETEMRGEK